ncbi:MAG: corrinoid protein-associated methyltransferase CpaM [Promethearchaeota archaeon]
MDKNPKQSIIGLIIRNTKNINSLKQYECIMSYVYMKSLEKKAEKYDKGIKILTLGRLPKIKQFIVENYLKKGETLLDIGMGTGTFAILCAKKGVNVVGIDFSEQMLEIARKNRELKDLNEFIEIIKIPVIELDKTFPDNSFDKITTILLLSELYFKEQEFCLSQIFRILKESGEFILVDEVKPKKFWKKMIYFLVKIPLVLITFIKSHLTTKAIKNLEERLEQHNFIVIEEKLYLLDTLKLIRSKKNSRN